MFKFLLYKFGQFCVRRLPLDRAYQIAVFLSDLQYHFSPRDRKAVEDNLKVILPKEKNLAPLVRDVFRNFGKYLVEFFRMSYELDDSFIKDRVKIENLDVLKNVMSQGKGVILLTAHIGNWELGAVILSYLGYPLTAIALPHKERPVNDLFNKQREVRGVTVVPMSQAIRRCLNAIHDNKIVALVADRDFTEKGEELILFGRKSLIPKGAAIFSYKTGAAIIPTFLTREKNNTFRISIHPPLYPKKVVPGEIQKEELLDLMRQYAAVIEKKISEYPTQWLMFRPFWKQ